jgi:ABC-2 type transport system permease protein
MGTMQQLLATPLRPAELVMGKMLAFFAVGVVDTVVAVMTGIYFFKVPFHGDVLLLAVSSGVFLCGTLFWGIYLSSLAHNQLMAFQMGLASSFLPAFLLSGFIYVIDSMPPVIQWITRVVPARYFVTIIRAIFQKGVGLEVLWLELTFLAVYAVVVFFLAARALRRRAA